MQNHRPENNENMNGKKTSLFFFNSEQLGEGTGCSRRLQQSCCKHRAILKRCSTTPPNTRTTFLRLFPFQKGPQETQKGTWKTQAWLWAGEASHIPSYSPQTDLDLPVGIKLLSKLTAEGYLGIFWTLNPGKVGSLHHLHCSKLSQGIVDAGVLWSMQSMLSKHYSQPS